MCPKDVMDIRIPRRDDDNRLMGPPIIELKFKKNILNPQRKISTKLKPVPPKKERNIKTVNTFSVLQEEDAEPLQKEEESPKIVKTDKDYEGKRRERLRKAHRESETRHNTVLSKNCSYERNQNKNSVLLRCKML